MEMPEELRTQLGREYAAPHQLTDEDLHAWVSRMENADGSVGAHWTEAQTNSIAQAAARGMDLSNYIKGLIKADMERND